MFKYLFVLTLLLHVYSSISANENECFPPCRSGFICHEGVCIEKCNPPCADDEKCNDEGECVKTENDILQDTQSLNEDSKAAEENDSQKSKLFHSKKIRYWGNSGFGPSTIEFANGGNLTVEYKKLLLSIINDYNWEWTLFDQREQANAIGFTVGTSFYRKYLTLTIATGPAFVWGDKLGDIIPDSGGWFSTDQYEEIEFQTIGLSTYTNIIFTPLPFLGIGIQGWGNWNRDMSYAGFMGCLYLGKLRK